MLRPLHTNILIEVLPPENKTEGGLFIPETSIKKNDKGKILAIGDKVKSAKVGDTAFLVQGFATKNPIEVDGNLYYLIQEHEILAYQEN